MAIDGDSMAATIKANLEDGGFQTVFDDEFLERICAGIVSEIQDNFIDTTYDTHIHDGTTGAGTVDGTLTNSGGPVTGITSTPVPEG